MRATATLSKPQAFRLDPIVEQAGAARGERRADRGLRFGRSVAEETPATTGAAHLCRGRAGCESASDQLVDDRRGDARRQPFPVLPLGRDLTSHLVPVAAPEGDAHRRRRVADALETVEDAAVAIDVALHDLPVVRAGMARRAGVNEDDAPFELAGIDLQRDSTDAVGTELD